MNPHITWERWRNPLLPRPEPDEDEDESLEERAAKDRFGPAESDYQGRVFVSATLGVVPLQEHNDPAKLMDLWVGHTDFDITPSVLRTVELVPGVELLRVPSRYRFWLGVAKKFDSGAVMRAVEDALFPPAPATPPPALLRAVGAQLAKRHKHWYVAVLPGGKLHTRGGDDVDALKAEAARTGAPAEHFLPSWS